MEKTKSLYVDRATWQTPICVDDFLVAIGAKQSNSVYHISEVKAKTRMNGRMIRYYLKVFGSDLPTALKRDKQQQLIPVCWYKR